LQFTRASDQGAVALLPRHAEAEVAGALLARCCSGPRWRSGGQSSAPPASRRS